MPDAPKIDTDEKFKELLRALMRAIPASEPDELRAVTTLLLDWAKALMKEGRRP